MNNNIELIKLDPLAEEIINKSIDNTTRKLVGGFRNKRNAPMQNQKPGIKTDIQNTINASNVESVMEAANRGQSWKEMISKSFSHGISSLKTLKFDGEFTIKNGQAEGLNDVPSKPGVYVVYDKENNPCYVGDSSKLNKRWVAGHLNEHKQKKDNGEEYKLAREFEEGCTVKYIECESTETAAAIEAHLIKNDKPRVNSKEELKNEQGTRSNIEAKKMKDASGNKVSLVKGAAVEGLKQGGAVIIEKLIADSLKFLKDELVDVFKGGKSLLIERIKRFFSRIWSSIKEVVKKPFDFLKGIFEFIVNAISKTISKIYNLARNIFDLGVAAIKLYKGSKSMSKKDLVSKITETIITGGAIIMWDAIDPIIEAKIVPVFGPFSPYIAAVMSAIGFGVTSHYLLKFVPQIIEFIMNFESGHQKARKEMILASQQLITNSEMNMKLTNGLKDYVVSTAILIKETNDNKRRIDDLDDIDDNGDDVLNNVMDILKK